MSLEFLSLCIVQIWKHSAYRQGRFTFYSRISNPTFGVEGKCRDLENIKVWDRSRAIPGREGWASMITAEITTVAGHWLSF